VDAADGGTSSLGARHDVQWYQQQAHLNFPRHPLILCAIVQICMGLGMVLSFISIIMLWSVNITRFAIFFSIGNILSVARWEERGHTG
jgi:hypothetical protein